MVGQSCGVWGRRPRVIEDAITHHASGEYALGHNAVTDDLIAAATGSLPSRAAEQPTAYSAANRTYAIPPNSSCTKLPTGVEDTDR